MGINAPEKLLLKVFVSSIPQGEKIIFLQFFYLKFFSSKNLSPKKRALENEEENIPPAKRLKPEKKTENSEKKVEEKSTPKREEKEPTTLKAEKIEIVQQEIKQLEEEILHKTITKESKPPEKEKTKEKIVEKMQPTIEKPRME